LADRISDGVELVLITFATVHIHLMRQCTRGTAVNSWDVEEGSRPQLGLPTKPDRLLNTIK
jgi:hypothetical protein